MAEELWIRVDDGGKADRFLTDLAEGDLLSDLEAIGNPEDRAARLHAQYGIDVSPWLLETLPSADAVAEARALLREAQYDQVRAGPAALFPVFCLLFPFPLPFLKGPEDSGGGRGPSRAA